MRHVAQVRVVSRPVSHTVCQQVRSLSSAGRGKGRAPPDSSDGNDGDGDDAKGGGGSGLPFAGFKLPSSLREADDGRFDDPLEGPIQSRRRGTGSSAPLQMAPGAPVPTAGRSPGKGAGRGKSIGRMGLDTLLGATGRGDALATPRSAAAAGVPGIHGRGRGKPLDDSLQRRLLPAEREARTAPAWVRGGGADAGKSGGGAAGTALSADFRKRAAGRGTELAGGFDRWRETQPLGDNDDDDDDRMVPYGRRREREGGDDSERDTRAGGAARGGRGGRSGGRGGRGGRGGGRGVGADDGVSAGGPRRRRGGRGEFGDSADTDAMMHAFERFEAEADAGHDTDEPFDGMTMREIKSLVYESQRVFPMRVPKPRGLARLLNPELADGPPRYDHEHPFAEPGVHRGLEPFHFEPSGVLDDKRVGVHRPSEVDRLLSTNEEEGELLLHAPRGALCSVDEWYEALQLPQGARMRRNPRFRRLLEEVGASPAGLPARPARPARPFRAKLPDKSMRPRVHAHRPRVHARRPRVNARAAHSSACDRAASPRRCLWLRRAWLGARCVQLSHPCKYSDEDKDKTLYALKFGMACDPVQAGYEGGKLPFEVEGFKPEEELATWGYVPPGAETAAASAAKGRKA